ncbi:hypothetical protein BGX24_005862 [Mortierella sp. AD032]|nr:hypothetical protein BGX24_005862 [Mortierella sp. AD032]
MTNDLIQQQNLESSPSSAEPYRKRIRTDGPLDVTSSNIITTASNQQTDQLPHAEPVSPSARNQWTRSVEDALLVLKKQRLEEGHQPVYIPPMAKANLQAPDDETFLLVERMQEFIASKRERYLWTNYIEGSTIPLFINLPATHKPEEDMVTKQLRNYNFMEDQIHEMKQFRQFILICDGYDESQLVTNLHKTNRLNQQGQWYAKMVISCRSQFLGLVYFDRFVPQPMDHDHCKSARMDLFQEAVIAPFSKKQVEDYVAR